MTSNFVEMTRRGLVAAAVIISFACTGNTTGSPGASSDVARSSDAASASDVAAAPTAAPAPTPIPTPPGTPAPVPHEVTVDSASIATPTPLPNATPTAPPQPGLWRIEGFVVDENGAPLAGVCVVVGPHGCKQYSPHTDEQGHWFLDIAVGTSTFDFYFEMPGYKTTWWQVTPKGPIEYDVILVKS